MARPRQPGRRWRPPPAPTSGLPRKPPFWAGVGLGLLVSIGLLTAHFVLGSSSS